MNFTLNKQQKILCHNSILIIVYFSIIRILHQATIFHQYFNKIVEVSQYRICNNKKFRMKNISLPAKFFAEFDMFAVPPTLRARKQSQTSSYTSGILSFILALFFTYVFWIGFYNVWNYSDIKSVETSTKLAGNQIQAKRIYFAVSVGYLTLQQIRPYFEIQAQIQYDDGAYKFPIQLQACKLQKWQQLGQNYQKKYNQYKLYNFLCPVSRDMLNIQKQYYAPNSSDIIISIKPCVAGPYCANETSRKQYIKQKTDVEGAIFMNVYLLDSILAPQQKNPVNFTINTDSQFAFTTKRGIIATMQLGSYHITTDKGIFPVEQIQEKTGYFLNSFRETSTQIETDDNNFATIYICLNRKHIILKREVGKLDQLLSYAGGLFSIITGFLSFFMVSYNKYRYELMVAEGVFNSDGDGNIVSENNFSFFTYIKYTIFDWIDLLFCRQVNWEDCKVVHEARQQANSHLDVTNLFKKISSLERALDHLLQQNEKDCLALLRPRSLNQIRRQRLVLEYYDQLIKGEPATTIQQYKTAKSLLKFSWKIYQKSMKTNKVINEDLYQTPVEFQIGSQIDRRKQESTQQIMDRFPEIVQSANAVKLTPQMDEVQNELSRAFYNLDEEKKSKFESIVPIKILARLKKKRDQKVPTQSQSSGDMSVSQKFNVIQPKNVRFKVNNKSKVLGVGSDGSVSQLRNFSSICKF